MIIIFAAFNSRIGNARRKFRQYKTAQAAS
jgi:hypothetical protein